MTISEQNQSLLLSISFEEKDKIKIKNCPEQTISLIKTCIQTSWPLGISQKSQPKPSLAEGQPTDKFNIDFALAGNPWEATQSLASDIRKLMISLLKEMKTQGWELIKGVKLTPDCKDTLFFQITKPQSSYLVSCLTFANLDSISLLGFPDPVAKHIHFLSQKYYYFDIKKMKEKYGAQRINIDDGMWVSNSRKRTHALKIVGSILSYLNSIGWIYLASIDILKGIKEQRSMEDVYFYYDYSKDQTLHGNLVVSTNPKTDFYNDYAAVSFSQFSNNGNGHDLVHIVNLKFSIANVIVSTIEKSGFKIKRELDFVNHMHCGDRESDCHGVFRYNLKEKIGNDVQSLELIMNLIKDLKRNGYEFAGSIDFSVQHFYKDTMFFRKCFPSDDLELFAIDVVGNDKMRFINAPDIVLAETKEAIKSVWANGIRDINQVANVNEYVLNGEPWKGAASEDGLVTAILTSLNHKGWKILASCYIMKGSKAEVVKDTIFMYHDSGVVSPLYHSEPSPKEKCHRVNINPHGVHNYAAFL